MKLIDRYAVGTIIGAHEGYQLFLYQSECDRCERTQTFTTRAVADATSDAEIEVCSECLTVKKFRWLRDTTGAV